MILDVLSVGAVWLAVSFVLAVWVGRWFSQSWLADAWEED